MARSIIEIYDQLASEKATFTSLDVYLTDPNDNSSTLDTSQNLLNNLTTTSKVDPWRLIFWVVAFGTWLHEQLWDDAKEDFNAIAQKATSGPKVWYQQMALDFQYGYALIWNGKKYVYTTIDPAAKLVTRCAINDAGGLIRIKVAGGAGTTPVQLTSPVELALTAFFEQVKFAGSEVLIINYPADEIRHQVDIYYNPQIDLTITKSLVEAAILNFYIKTNFTPEGKFIVSNLVRDLKALDGVVIPDVNNIDFKPNGGAWTAIDNEYETVAGYCIQSSAYSFTDNYTNGLPTIRYIPYF